ncbi:hypothetical protein [Catenulispora rubra]|nr:hypothetical protein [Catenulispora rubra]
MGTYFLQTPKYNREFKETKPVSAPPAFMDRRVLDSLLKTAKTAAK